ncbi:MAG: hypothetical protein ACQEQF_08385 [Bacillota bacterium]
MAILGDVPVAGESVILDPSVSTNNIAYDYEPGESDSIIFRVKLDLIITILDQSEYMTLY